MQTLQRMPETEEIDLFRPGITKLSSGGAVIKQLVAGLLGGPAPHSRYRAPATPKPAAAPKPLARTAATAAPPVADRGPTPSELAQQRERARKIEALEAERDRLKRQLAAAERERSLLQKRQQLRADSTASRSQQKVATSLKVQLEAIPKLPAVPVDAESTKRFTKGGMRTGLHALAASIEAQLKARKSDQ